MTSTHDQLSAGVAVRRSETDLWLDQLHGVDAWCRANRATGLLLEAAPSREMRVNLSRRRAVVDRQRQAIVEWTSRQLQESERPLHLTAEQRAVIVHRKDWFKDKLTTELEAGGITVVASLENGADAVGVVVAEQPDVLLVEDKLPMVNGLDVARAARQYAPRTRVVAQVANNAEIGPFLDAGAATAYLWSVPPADIAADLLAFLEG